MKEFIIANPELCGVVAYFVGLFATYYLLVKTYGEEDEGKYIRGAVFWPLAVVAFLIERMFKLLDNLAKK